MDDLRNLLDNVRTLTAVESGDYDLDLFNKYRLVGTDAVMVVPWQLADYGLSRQQAAEVWEAVWHDPDSLLLWAAYMEALRVHHNIPLPPAPVIREPVATSRSIRHKPDNPIVSVLKSLAGRRGLKR